jgi:hypothetical protein
MKNSPRFHLSKKSFQNDSKMLTTDGINFDDLEISDEEKS